MCKVRLLSSIKTLSYHKYLKREYEQEKKARYSNKGWLYATLLSFEDHSSVGAAPNVFPRGPQKITGLYHSKFVIATSSRRISLRSRCLEVAGERENGHARGSHASGVACLLLARPARFFLRPLLPSACYAGYKG